VARNSRLSDAAKATNPHASELCGRAKLCARIDTAALTA